jgi:hypothetical protein
MKTAITHIGPRTSNSVLHRIVIEGAPDELERFIGMSLQEETCSCCGSPHFIFNPFAIEPGSWDWPLHLEDQYDDLLVFECHAEEQISEEFLGGIAKQWPTLLFDVQFWVNAGGLTSSSQTESATPQVPENSSGSQKLGQVSWN